MNEIVLMTDHGSHEGSGAVLVAAVEMVTGTAPIVLDARAFMTGGNGRTTFAGGVLTLEIPSEDVRVTPAAVVVYEIPPIDRRRFASFQRRLRECRTMSLGTDVEAWRQATEKDLTVEQFMRDGIRHMETISLRHPSMSAAAAAFERLGGDVWARPTVGLGGSDVFHITTHDQLHDAHLHYSKSGRDWLVARDARNFDHNGRRHQFRIVVLGDRVLRVCEHVQADPDAPCNEIQGAISTVVPVGDVPDELLELAVSSTRSLGLPFGGVDLAIENRGVVFEVNVHPVFGVDGGLEMVAVPYVEAHLTHASGHLRWETTSN